MKRKHERRDEAPAAVEVASATECTGLMAALPEDEEADERLAALYRIHEAKR